MAVPGWPDLAFAGASIAKPTISLIARSSRGDACSYLTVSTVSRVVKNFG